MRALCWSSFLYRMYILQTQFGLLSFTGEQFPTKSDDLFLLGGFLIHAPCWPTPCAWQFEETFECPNIFKLPCFLGVSGWSGLRGENPSNKLRNKYGRESLRSEQEKRKTRCPISKPFAIYSILCTYITRTVCDLRYAMYSVLCTIYSTPHAIRYMRHAKDYILNTGHFVLCTI